MGSSKNVIELKPETLKCCDEEHPNKEDIGSEARTNLTYKTNRRDNCCVWSTMSQRKAVIDEAGEIGKKCVI